MPMYEVRRRARTRKGCRYNEGNPFAVKMEIRLTQGSNNEWCHETLTLNIDSKIYPLNNPV